jgi:hypothetical protein
VYRPLARKLRLLLNVRLIRTMSPAGCGGGLRDLGAITKTFPIGWRHVFFRSVRGLQPRSAGHSFHCAGAPYKCLYGGAPYKSPNIAENRRKSPKIRASGRPSRATHITTDRKIEFRRPYKVPLEAANLGPITNGKGGKYSCTCFSRLIQHMFFKFSGSNSIGTARGSRGGNLILIPVGENPEK